MLRFIRRGEKRTQESQDTTPDATEVASSANAGDEAEPAEQGKGLFSRFASKLGLPIRFIGVGEQVEDLRPFSAPEFIDAIFDESTGA